MTLNEYREIVYDMDPRDPSYGLAIMLVMGISIEELNRRKTMLLELHGINPHPESAFE